MSMNQPSDSQSSGSDAAGKQYATRRPSQQAPQSRLSLGVIAGLLLVIPIAIFLRKGYISQQDENVPLEKPLEPVQMIKSVPSIVVARKMLPDSEEETDILKNAYGDRIGSLFEYHLPGDRKITIPRAGFEELFLSDLKTDEIPSGRLYILDRLYFASGSSELNDESLAQIKATAAILQAYPVLRIQLRGHTDNSGSEEVNLELSNERAHSVMVALIKQGVLPMRLSIQGMGSEESVAENETEEGKMRNRRIDLSIVQSAEYGPSVYSY